MGIVASTVIFGVIICLALSELSTKGFERLVESRLVEIIYLSVSIAVAVLFQVRPIVVLFMMAVLALYELIKVSEKEMSRERQQIELYQIFSFINNQIRAGLRMEDVIIGIHQVVQNRKMKERIRRIGLAYAQTYDLDQFLASLELEFSAEEFKSIDYILRNCVALGVNENVMTFQEDMMFNRYIGVIRKRGDRTKLKLFLAGLLLSVVLFIQIGYPLYLEFMTSLESIY